MVQRPRILPPVWLLLMMACAWALQRWVPIVRVVPEAWAPALTLLSLALGLVMIAWSVGLFSKAGTGIVPFDEARALVVGGFYRVTRNPMYLGMVLVLAALAFRAGQLGGFLPIPVFMWVIQRQFIIPEEAFLEDAFGEEYRRYRQRVRRWL